MQQTENTFGTWLRRQRRQMDLTQLELAARLDYSVVTIRKLERDELRPSRQLAERLAEFFDVSTAYRPKLVAFARMQPSHSEPEVSSPGASPVPTNLPVQLTPFFGRTAELLELANYLSDPACRLLTIVGSGGIGKTRLALEVTHTLPVQPPHGIYFVALAQLRATEHIVPAIAEALDLRFQADGRSPQQQLLDYLRHKQMLLVLDNFEHLKDGVELLLEILQHCPGVRLLVTARERLQLTIETVYVVDGMDFPATNAGHAAGTYSAIQLFVASARRGRRKFTLDANNEQDVVRICHLVGGVPLAIILAAAWIKVLSPAEIAAELSQDLDFLAAELYDLPARHQSMRAVLAQSWQRLGADEQAVFMRLAVFRGGFTRAAAQSVAGASLRTLSALTSKSMVRRDANGRYAIHELLRQFGEAELEAAGQRLAAGAAHCAYYMDYLHRHEPDIKGRRQVPALNEIEADFENVRAAWQWASLQRDYEAVERALEATYWFCEMRSRFYDGLELLRAGREHLAPSAGVAPHPVWGSLMSHVLGQDFRWFEPPAESRTRIEQALALAQANENRTEIAFCLWRLAMAALLCEDVPAAITCFEQSIEHYRALGDRFYLACLHRNYGILHLVLNQSDRSHQLLAQSAALCREIGDSTGLAQPVATLGWFVYNDGYFVEAGEHWQEARALCLETGARYALINVQLGLIWVDIFYHGDFYTAAALAEELRAIALDLDDSQSKHRMLLVDGFLAGISEDYQTCQRCFQDAVALEFPYFPYTASLEAMGLCLAACGLERAPDTTKQLEKVLSISLINRWPANAAKAMALAAVLAAKAGNPQRATELLSLAFQHPLSPKGWLIRWPLITRLQDELKAVLTPAGFAAAWEHGGNLDLMATAAAVAAELA